MKKPLLSLWIFSVAVLVTALAGCATGHKIKVDALAAPGAENSIAYRIKTSNPGLDPKSLHYQEAERLVKTALSGKGLYEAPKPEMADIIVDLDYGISAPKANQEVRREKIYRTVSVPDRTERIVTGYDKDGRAITDTISVPQPTREEEAGEREVVFTTVTYEKHLRLSARSNTPAADERPPAEIWTVDVITEGKNRDLRKALPVLAAATIEYVGKDSHGQQTIRLKDGDDAIAFVKKGL
ncbi:MAG TPA: hypothetical protein VHO24_04890 [Opitutaceae bacterium]|nr:hypothetical protein [Opitutaceae bacterium]